MVDNRSGGASTSGGGSRMGWLPWLLGALVLLGGLTVVDVLFYRDDIHAEASHEEEEHEGEGGEETDTGTNLIEPRDEDEGSGDDH